MGAEWAEIPNLRALDHVGYAVGNLDRSIHFYTTLLESEPIMRKTWDVPYVGEIVGYRDLVLEGAFFALPGGVILELLEYKNPAAGSVDMESYNAGNAHLCLVSQNLSIDYERLRAAGYDTFRSAAPVAIPWGPYRGGRACYLRDPDGVSIELLEEPPGGADWSA